MEPRGGIEPPNARFADASLCLLGTGAGGILRRVSKQYPQCTCTITPCVEVRVLGAKDDRPSDLPRIRVDDGLVSDMMRWMRDEEIYPRVPGGVSGGGCYVAFHDPEDAEKIWGWLKERGVAPGS